MAQENEHHGFSGTSAPHQPTASTLTTISQQDDVLTSISIEDPWQDLKQFTQARIALGRTGSSLTTKAVLDFSCAHAMARDAVHLALDVNSLADNLHAQGLKTLQVHSRATDRHTYLLRPDFGRRLDETSVSSLQYYSRQNHLEKPIDLLLVVGDGLSSMAVTQQAAKLIAEIQSQMPSHWNLGPVVIAQQARVALADEVSELLNARIVAMLIGERPGLSSPDSLGVYLTYNAKVGCTDADRNCISNVRPEGLVYAAAAKKLLWLCEAATRMQCSGIALKDESDTGGFIAASSISIAKS
ncbi:MAG: ethanolamine ammonia-lyase subunit EutC [Cellvibrio sp.]|uniref:ethanolamine ammonia-lyase subunit EutC n=1 Tax=Cellvibrio sp. TaxID=1965322 RepID=UPI00271DA8A0|nr:ethanolamine ammonia-lyase subunit EutC [Cellvibrio sp.]